MSVHSRRQFILRRSPHIALRRILESTPHRQSSSRTLPSDPRRVHLSRARCAKLAVRHALPPLSVQPTPLPSRLR